MLRRSTYPWKTASLTRCARIIARFRTQGQMAILEGFCTCHSIGFALSYAPAGTADLLPWAPTTHPAAPGATASDRHVHLDGAAAAQDPAGAACTRARRRGTRDMCANLRGSSWLSSSGVTILPDYKEFGGRQAETAALAHTLNYLGITAPDTSLPFS